MSFSGKIKRGQQTSNENIKVSLEFASNGLQLKIEVTV